MDFFFRDDVSVCHGYDAVGDGCHREVVGNDYECLTESVAQVGDDVAYLIAVSGVEAACRFIGKNQRRPLDDCTGGGNTLPLSPG